MNNKIIKFKKTKRIFIPILSLFILCPTIYYSLIHTNDKIDFNTEIRPILNAKCISCHGGVRRLGGFSLLFPSDALAVSESGKKAIVPGKPEESEMMKRIITHDKKLRMPLGTPRMSDEEIEKIRKWIAQGAKWDDHWAYVKPKQYTPPQSNNSWIKNDIDRFVLARLEKEGIKPSEEADRATLIRRLSLDLIGLPPTLSEVNDFTNDKSPHAYEKVVNRLMASPHYGERWAALWMDLARFADSKGWVDQYRSIWAFRDWVIDAFNHDKPFDEFTIEQLAGDLLPAPTEKQLIASAFHRNAVTWDEQLVDADDIEEVRVTEVLDRVNTTMEVWQATTMSCVQCHSHPTDPFRHEEFYKFSAYFNNIEDDNNDGPILKWYPGESDKEVKELCRYICEKEGKVFPKKINATAEFVSKILPPFFAPSSNNGYKKITFKDKVAGFILDSAYLRFNNIDLSEIDQVAYNYGSKGNGGIIEMRLDSLQGKIMSSVTLDTTGGWDIWRTKSADIKSQAGKHDVYLIFRAHKKVKNKFAGLFDIHWVYFHNKSKLKASPELLSKRETILDKKTIFIPVMRERSPDSTKRKTFVFVRGNWRVHGKEVTPGVPGSLNPMVKGEPNGTRLGVAKWLVSKENPLTARVTINRFWEQLFGNGIVETVEDFGTRGAKPTHPELMDWLALQFMNEQKWSMKKMVKQIVMSATYRQSSKVSPEMAEKDPKNELLARGSRVRLSSEQIRDQSLAVSGILSKKMFGPSVMPHQPKGVFHLHPIDKSVTDWVMSPGEDKNRRGLYTYWKRLSPHPSMQAFDSPDRNTCTSHRVRTNTPLQALVTLNDTTYLVAARAFANRMMKEGGKDVGKQIQYGYKLALAKDPNANVNAELNKLYKNINTYYLKHPEKTQALLGNNNTELASMTIVARTILNLDGFIMKE